MMINGKILVYLYELIPWGWIFLGILIGFMLACFCFSEAIGKKINYRLPVKTADKKGRLPITQNI